MSQFLDSRHLRLVAEVARTESVTRAADRLNVTQSAVSHQLRELEDRLGTPIFVRSGRRMLPTPAGRLLVDAAGQRARRDRRGRGQGVATGAQHLRRAARVGALPYRVSLAAGAGRWAAPPLPDLRSPHLARVHAEPDRRAARRQARPGDHERRVGRSAAALSRALRRRACRRRAAATRLGGARPS